MTKIAIIGYGQMGKLLEQLAPSQNLEVVAIIDPLQGTEISNETLADAEVCIDFTIPEALVPNVTKMAELGKNIVIGTTGWLDKIDEISRLAETHNIGIVYGSNFSVGMNIFFKAVAYACSLMGKVAEYDVFGYELHHNRKMDSPSGTAKTLADIVLANTPDKTEAQYDRVDRKINDEEFHLASIRAGNIPGTHVIGFDSSADTIELKHTARNREGFALGALKAAQWAKGKTGFHNFLDIFEEIIQ